jgi:hypothetical protein
MYFRTAQLRRGVFFSTGWTWRTPVNRCWNSLLSTTEVLAARRGSRWLTKKLEVVWNSGWIYQKTTKGTQGIDKWLF